MQGSEPQMPAPAGSPRVSVLLPTYNRAHFLIEAIQSVLRQSLVDLELIVVDDGSSDETQAAVSHIADPRVRLLRQDHRGTATALNTGLAAARGQYIARIDDDDVWLPHLLATEVAVLDAHPEVGLVYGRCEMMAADGSPTVGGRGFPLKFPEDSFRSLLYADYTVSITSIIRRACFDRVGAWDQSILLSEDWDMALRVARHYPPRFVDDIVARVRRHAGNSTSSESPQFAVRLRERERVLDKIFGDPNLGPEIAALAPIAYRNLHTGAGMQYLLAGQGRCAFVSFGRALRSGGNPARTAARIAWCAFTWLFIERYAWSRDLANRVAARTRALEPRT
jgi:glycosyltransferase involved in cell wall biosynthesis